ncbi:MAG TPA: hypothetical protein DDW52_15060 [Planctomycetaceae bacterium]|nr:hypothetical protein [Planctomycetaceae bacterium]
MENRQDRTEFSARQLKPVSIAQTMSGMTWALTLTLLVCWVFVAAAVELQACLAEFTAVDFARAIRGW